MNNTELQKLCESVGRRLTDKPCQVRFRQPAFIDANGTACKRNRTAVLDIKPGLGSKEFLHTFLHELGHVKTLWGSWTMEIPDIQSGSLRIPEIFETSSEISFIEQEADRLAGEWFQYANEHADEREGSWLVKRLKALEHYMEHSLVPVSEELVVRAVNAGVENAMAKVRKNFEGR